MQKKKVIAKYAIGGGIAAIFYMEPMLTYDLDIFIFRIAQLLERVKIDMKYLMGIFGRHGLLDKWQTFQKKFYDK